MPKARIPNVTAPTPPASSASLRPRWIYPCQERSTCVASFTIVNPNLHNVGHKRRHLENYILKARKAKDQASDSKSSSLDGNHKSEHNGDKAIRGGLESDVKGKIAQLETPLNESDKDSRDRTS